MFNFVRRSAYFIEFQQTLTDYTEKTSIQLTELRFFLFSRFFLVHLMMFFISLVQLAPSYQQQFLLLVHLDSRYNS